MTKIQAAGLGVIFLFTGILRSTAQGLLTAAKDSQPTSRQVLLLIPFPEEMYLSDAEPDIMRFSNQTPEIYRPFFREELNRVFASSLGADFKVVNAMHDSLLGTLLFDWYDQCGYLYAPVKRTAEKSKTKFRLSLRNDSVPAKDPDQHSASRYHPNEDEKANFMHCRADDSLWIMRFSRPFSAKYVLSINQFEIKTHYSQCVDISRQLYKREIRVHYSVYSSEGDFVYGNYSSHTFNSGMNRYDEIVEYIFPELAANVTKQIEEITGK